MNITQQSSPIIYEKEQIEKEEKKECEFCFMTYICENTDSILDPIDQMTFALNETAIKYGPIIVLKDALWYKRKVT